MRYGTVFFALFLWSSGVAADQNDPKLDLLFQDLLQTNELEKGQIITQEIWQVWNDIGDEEAKNLLNRGVTLMEEPDYRAALITLTTLTERKPEFAEGWNRRANLLYMMGAYELSLIDIRKTLLLEPRHFGAISGLGQIYARQNRFGEAREAFKRALEINPHLTGARINVQRLSEWLNESSI